MCLYPRLIQNRKYIPNIKNGGQVPPVFDNRVLAVPVGCGKCMECRKQKMRNWQVRLSEELKSNNKAEFITLTFSDESLRSLRKAVWKKENNLKGYELENAIATLAVRRFLERWRKDSKKSIRHWLVTELGTTKTERIHLHGLIWSEDRNRIQEKWKYGIVGFGKYVNEKTVNYIVKYVNKGDNVHREYNSIVLTSKGIGSTYVKSINSKNNIYIKGKTDELYRTRNGTKMALPTYYRNKIYSDQQREKLWLEKLDQNIRYVNGIKVDVSKGNEIYYKLLAQERAKNKRLGYGDDKKNWERLEYEEKRRRLLGSKETIEITEKQNKTELPTISTKKAFG